MMRLRRVALRIRRGVNRVGISDERFFGVPGECTCCGVKYGIPGTGALRLDKVIFSAQFCFIIERYEGNVSSSEDVFNDV